MIGYWHDNVVFLPDCPSEHGYSRQRS